MIATTNEVQKVMLHLTDRIDNVELQISSLLERIERKASDVDFFSRVFKTEAASLRRAIDDVGVAVIRRDETIERLQEQLGLLVDYLGVELQREPERVVTEDGYVVEHEGGRDFYAKKGRK